MKERSVPPKEETLGLVKRAEEETFKEKWVGVFPVWWVEHHLWWLSWKTLGENTVYMFLFEVQK